MSARAIFRGQVAAACRQHAKQMTDTEIQEMLRETADKFIMRAVEVVLLWNTRNQAQLLVDKTADDER